MEEDWTLWDALNGTAIWHRWGCNSHLRRLQQGNDVYDSEEKGVRNEEND